jgi:hypothetical protein
LRKQNFLKCLGEHESNTSIIKLLLFMRTERGEVIKCYNHPIMIYIYIVILFNDEYNHPIMKLIFLEGFYL